MSNYKGYLVKFGGTKMPNGYFNEYDSTPNRISEADAGTDQTGMLWRSPLPHKRSSITFSTHILFLDEKIKFQQIINGGIVNSAERKAFIEYWNDEVNDYRTGYFYIPDIKYSVMDADEKTIRYNPISVELIEY